MSKSNYGPPSVASSYAEDQQMSHTDYHQKSYQDDQWAKATGQDISQNFEVRYLYISLNMTKYLE